MPWEPPSHQYYHGQPMLPVINEDYGQQVMNAMITSSWDQEDKDSSSASDISSDREVTVFEERGVSLSLLRHIGAASEKWLVRHRVMLNDGQCGIILSEHIELDDDSESQPQQYEDIEKDEMCWIQLRKISQDDDREIVKEYVNVPRSTILCDNLIASIGERVTLFQTLSDKMTAIDETEFVINSTDDRDIKREFGVVVDVQFDHIESTVHYVIEICDCDLDIETCNYTLKDQQSSTASQRTVMGDVILRDPCFTTKDACEEIIKPLTRRSGRSLVRCLASSFTTLDLVEPPPSTLAGISPPTPVLSSLSTSPDTTFDSKDENGSTSFLRTGKAKAFISHAWRYRFIDVVDSIQINFMSQRSNHKHINDIIQQQQQQGEGGFVTTSNEYEAITSSKSHDDIYQAMHECFLWFDICTVPQHSQQQSLLSTDFFFNEFKQGIKAINNTVLVMIPLRDPLPLKRAWCVWEIFCSLDCGATFTTALTMKDQLYLDTHSIILSLNPDVRNASSWKEQDTVRIIEACESVQGGCDRIDLLVSEAFGLDQVQRSISSHRDALLKSKALRKLFSPRPQNKHDKDKGEEEEEEYDSFTFFNFINLSSLTLGMKACLVLEEYFKELSEIYKVYLAHKLEKNMRNNVDDDLQVPSTSNEEKDEEVVCDEFPTLSGFTLLGVTCTKHNVCHLLKSIRYLPGLLSFAFNSSLGIRSSRAGSRNTRKLSLDSECITTLAESISSTSSSLASLNPLAPPPPPPIALGGALKMRGGSICSTLHSIHLQGTTLNANAFADLMYAVGNSVVMSLYLEGPREETRDDDDDDSSTVNHKEDDSDDDLLQESAACIWRSEEERANGIQIGCGTRALAWALSTSKHLVSIRFTNCRGQSDIFADDFNIDNLNEIMKAMEMNQDCVLFNLEFGSCKKVTDPLVIKSSAPSEEEEHVVNRFKSLLQTCALRLSDSKVISLEYNFLYSVKASLAQMLQEIKEEQEKEQNDQK